MTADKSSQEAFADLVRTALKLAHEFPNYRFELIHEYIQALTSGALGVDELKTQFAALPEERQLAGLQIFDSAILRAKQVNYQPVNELDAFIERQLYGVKDAKAVEKGIIGKLLKNFEAPSSPPNPAAQPRARKTGPIPPRPPAAPNSPGN